MTDRIALRARQEERARLAKRLRELSILIARGDKDALLRELTMRIPAEPGRDADLVTMRAAEIVEESDKGKLFSGIAIEASRIEAYCKDITDAQFDTGTMLVARMANIATARVAIEQIAKGIKETACAESERLGWRESE